MAGNSDWMVSFSRCDTLTAARIGTAVERDEASATRGAEAARTVAIWERGHCTNASLGYA